MAEVIKKARNHWAKGIVMDFSPENTKNDTLTYALNATLLTFNGNELSLQNDMGNARVETAYLPEGYMPVGTCEYGGIIYIVSYNPLEDKSQIGCFPSPERNISSDELGISDVQITKEFFQGENGEIKQTSQCVMLKNDPLNPGDKFIITSDSNIYNNKLKDLQEDDMLIDNPIIALNIVSIEDSGKITYLNSEVRQYQVGKYSYSILGGTKDINNEIAPDLDAYRNAVSSGYNVFKSKTSGRLAILAELIMIDSYNVTHSLQPTKDADNNIIEGKFDIILHTEVSPELNSNNYSQAPKLKYYYLQNSQGYLQVYDDTLISKKLFKEDGTIDETFGNIELKDIYTYQNDSVNNIFQTEQEDGSLKPDTLGNQFNFPNTGTYHANIIKDENETIIGYDYLPKQDKYEDIKLGSIQIPEKVVDYGLDLPFKYDYTIVPCMEYGKLEHLAVSNTIDFSKLHAFNQSNFHTWKYFIENNHLKLTFGVDVYDTYEQHKVDGIFLEFYDLWGFAGSLEITDKKSYSGTFTKIIPLNSLGVLSKIDHKGKTRKRNINIQYDGTKFTLNGKGITEITEFGWDISDADNDCGTLYSNIIYGVKVYLKRSTNNEYICKNNFFLFTLPIYNEYYYTVKNFDTITNPKLQFLLTYKLQDSSNRLEYTGNGIINGYTTEDSENIKKYLKGDYKEPSLNITKYYKYKGTSKLQLELGLLKDYEKLDLYSSPNLNNYFDCKIQLCSNDNPDKTYTISSDNSEILGGEEILNYNGNELNNLLSFNNNNHIMELSSGIRNYNFINPSDTPQAILIKYEFIIGYRANVLNIAPTQVPATTICALFHQNQNECNYSDFGMYQKGEDILYKTMFYNSGTSTKEEFGLCTQNTTIGTLIEQCSSIAYTGDEALDIKEQFRFNTGSRLKELYSHIGKLTFCQPHVHGLSSVESNNLECINDNSKILGITGEYGGFKIGNHHDDIYGTFPTKHLYNDPQYNLSFNTLNSVKYNSEFISAIDYFVNDNLKFTHLGWDQNEGGIGNSATYVPRIYTGFTGEEVANFNKKLLTTMSSIYAYNPDYDLLTVNAGTVNVQEYSPIFTSNIINIYSNFDISSEQSLNDYIYMRGMIVSNYLENLETYSGIKTSVDQLSFTEDFTYCGIETSPYLITNLTYKSEVPTELIKDLTFDTSERIIVKLPENGITYIQGPLNKKALYGYDQENNNLIQLDVSNYTINQTNGELLLKNTEELAYGQHEIAEFKVSTHEDLGWGKELNLEGQLLYITVEASSIDANNKDFTIQFYKDGISLHSKNSYPISFKVRIDRDDVKGEFTMRSGYYVDIDGDNFEGTYAPYMDFTLNIGDDYIFTLRNTSTNTDYSNFSVSIDNFKLRKKDINQIIPTNITLKYSNFIDYKYVVIDDYKNACIADTSITLNDLVYEPNIDGHRLFMKNGLFKYDVNLRGKIYYRQLPLGWNDRWDVSKYKNNIFMATGPSFIKDWESYYNEINTTQETIL